MNTSDDWRERLFAVWLQGERLLYMYGRRSVNEIRKNIADFRRELGLED